MCQQLDVDREIEIECYFCNGYSIDAVSIVALYGV